MAQKTDSRITDYKCDANFSSPGNRTCTDVLTNNPLKKKFLPLPSLSLQQMPMVCEVMPFAVVLSLSCVRLFVLHGLQHARLPCPSPSQSLLKLMSIELMPSNNLILYHPLLFLSSIFLSIRVFPNESAPCIRWPKSWSFSFSISSFNEYSGFISFRVDYFDLFAVQGTLKNLLQHHRT